MPVHIAVFTRDLRIADNPVLAAAAHHDIVPLFVIDDHLAARASANRLAFLLAALTDLDRSLQRLGGHLVIRRGNWVTEVLRVADDAGATHIHVAADVSGYAVDRLHRLERAAAAVRIGVTRHPGITVVAPGALTPTGGDHFKVFSAYHRRWLTADWRARTATPGRLRVPAIDRSRIPSLTELTRNPPAPACAPGGETAAHHRLDAFVDHQLAHYEQRHDDLAGDETSRLAPYLHFGCLSPLDTALRVAGHRGSDAFIRQLCWRDFFHQILAARPTAARADYRPRDRPVRHDPEALAAWQNGATGYPVVDAAMHQLVAEGFMHNRARMIVASFLTKDLDLDWRLGATHFMNHLVDADVANNQLNWQWVAGTGTDTNPHRIFNPTVQSRRFDPQGDYIRRYLPALAGLPASSIHDPAPLERAAAGYPLPIVDHHAAIAAYRAR